jgi:hypothetical protein
MLRVFALLPILSVAAHTGTFSSHEIPVCLKPSSAKVPIAGVMRTSRA